MQRRQLLKTAAGAAVVGSVGVGAFAGTGSAATVSITSNKASLSNDDGEVRKVYIDPEITVNWDGFDDAVGAVSIFVEAAVEGGPDGPNPGGFFPLHRSEPVLLPGTSTGMKHGKPGTSGTFAIGPFSDLEGNRADGDDWSNGLSSDGRIRVVDAEEGAPDYAGAGASEGYLQGANVYGATIPDTEAALVNGEYGAASGDEPVENADDGTTQSTVVRLRYTIQLLELGLNHFESITGYDPVAEAADNTVGAVREKLEEWYDETTGRWAEGLGNHRHLDDVAPEDITVAAFDNAGDFTTADDAEITWETNQKLLAMAGSGDYAMPAFNTSRHAADARQYESDTGIPSVLVAADDSATNFQVAVTNEESSGGASGSGNSGAT